MTAAAARVRLLCLDVDGVLTDGTILIDDAGRESKRFSVRDGLGIVLWRRLGFEVAVVTGRSGQALRHRLEELGVRHLYSGVGDKHSAFLAACEAAGCSPAEAAFVGDDLPDLPALRACGYPVAVQDAEAPVRAVAAHVTAAVGGDGAVREVVEHLLRAKDRWNDALAMFDDPSHPAGGERSSDERPRSA